MTNFDALFISVYKRYNPKYKRKANRIALLYISFLKAALLLLLGVFFAKFFNQMNTNVMSEENAWILFGMAVVGIHIGNWLKYNGKQRSVLNAKMTRKNTSNISAWKLWLIPLGVLSLALILLKAV